MTKFTKKTGGLKIGPFYDKVYKKNGGLNDC